MALLYQERLAKISNYKSEPRTDLSVEDGMINVIIIADLEIFVARLDATVTYRELLDAFRKTFADPTNLPTFNAVIDMRNATAFDLSQDTLLTLASIVGEQRTNSYKVAYVVSTPLQIGMSNMCMAFTKMCEVEECQQFEGLKEAFLFVCKDALSRQKVLEGKVDVLELDTERSD